jgi:hypothetical protein
VRSPATISIEIETAGESAYDVRMRVGGAVVGENLTAVQSHLLVGEMLQRIAAAVEKSKLPLDIATAQGPTRCAEVAQAMAVRQTSRVPLPISAEFGNSQHAIISAPPSRGFIRHQDERLDRTAARSSNEYSDYSAD